MPITYKDLKQNEDLRSDFMALTSDQRDIAFGRMKVPSGFSLSQTQLLQSKILSMPTTSKTTGQPDSPLSWGGVPFEALKNIPSSAVELGKNIYQSIRHPIQTEEALEKVAIGGIQKLIPGKQEAEKTFDATTRFFVDRYGGVENLKRTISSDPVGFLSDASIVLGGTGTALKAGKIAKAAQIGEKISKTARYVDPIAGPLKVTSKVAGKFLPGKTRSLVKSAVKFPVENRLNEVDKLKYIDNMADEFISRGLKVDRATRDKLGINIQNTQNKINNIIRSGEKAGVKIKPQEIISGLNDLMAEIDNIPIKTPDLIRELKIINDYKNKILSSRMPGTGKIAGIAKPIDLTPTEIQSLKVLLNKSYKASIETTVDAVKTVARNKIRHTAKTILEDRFPELKSLNKNQGVMIELQSAIAKRIREVESARTFDVPGLAVGGIAGAGAALVTGTYGGSASQIALSGLTFATIAFVGGKVLNSPAVQLKLARALNFANKQAARAGKLNIITQPAFQAGRIARESGALPQETPNELNTIKSNVIGTYRKMLEVPENRDAMKARARNVIDRMGTSESMPIINNIRNVINSNISAKNKADQIDSYLADQFNNNIINPTEIDAFNVYAAETIKIHSEMKTEMRKKKTEYIDKLSTARLHSNINVYKSLMEESSSINGLNILDSDVKKAMDIKQKQLSKQGMSDNVKNQLQGNLPISIQ